MILDGSGTLSGSIRSNLAGFEVLKTTQIESKNIKNRSDSDLAPLKLLLIGPKNSLTSFTNRLEVIRGCYLTNSIFSIFENPHFC